MSDCSIEKITPFMISKMFHSKMEQNPTQNSPIVQFVTLRLRGRPGQDGCQSALWDCFGRPKTVPHGTSTTISTKSPAQPQSGPELDTTLTLY